MKKVLFLSCDSLAGFVTDDQLLAAKLKDSRRYEVSTASWSSKTNWSLYDVVIIRTTWDYTQRHQEFLTVLKEIEDSGAQLLNPLSTVKWNYHKGYLSELQEAGIFIVPTVFFEAKDKPKIPDAWNANRFIIKPAISASAKDTKILSRAQFENELATHLHPGSWLLQPYLEHIKDGELSLHYFHGVFSHAILKTPKAGDFRVQEEHGGIIQPFTPERKLLRICEDILQKVAKPLLYARVDVIELAGSYALMELELIEPALYFRTAENSPANFLKALDQLVR